MASERRSHDQLLAAGGHHGRGFPRGVPIGQALLAVLLIGQCALILSIPRFVTVDGPSHLGLATSFWDRLLNPNSVVREYVTAQILPATNLIPDIPAGLLARALPVEMVSKIIICLAVVGLPLAMAWALHGTSGRRWWLAFLVIPLAPTFTLQYGFYPYSTGLVGLAVVMGFMVRLRGTRSSGTLAGLGVVLTLTYMAHLMPFLLAVGFIACCVALDTVTHRPTGESRLMAFLPLTAAVPGLALSSFGFVAAMTDPWTRLVNDGLGDGSGFSKGRAVGIAQLARGTVVFDSRERFLTSIVALLVAGLALIALAQRLRTRSLCGADAYLIFAGVTLLIALTIPNSASFGAGGSHMSQRLALVPFLALLLWIAESLPPKPSTLDKRIGIAAACGSLIVTIGLDTMRLPSYVALSDAALAYESVAPCIAKNSTMVQVNLGGTSLPGRCRNLGIGEFAPPRHQA